MKKPGRLLMILVAVLLVGTALRLWGLTRQSVWMDEAYSVRMSADLVRLWFEQEKDSSPPLYYSILHLWIRCFGKNEFSIRLLSVIFGSLLIPLIFFAGKTIFDARTGILAALLAAVSPIHIYYSQEARMYSFLPLVSLASFLSLFMALKKKREPRWWGAYIITTVLCLYTHNYGVLLWAAGVCFYVFFERERRAILRSFLLSFACIAFACIPRVVVLFAQAGLDMNPWIKTVNATEVWYSFLYLTVLNYRLPVDTSMMQVLIVAVPVFVIVFVLGLTVVKRENLFVSAYLFIPLALAVGISFWLPIYVAGRYDMSVFPAFCLVTAYGLGRFRPLPRALLLAVIGAVYAISLFHYYFLYEKSNDRTVARYIQDHAHEGDIIVATELTALSFEYYWERKDCPRLFSFPEGPAAYLTRDALEGRRMYLDFQAQRLIARIRPLLVPGNRVWVIYHPLAADLVQRLAREMEFERIFAVRPGSNFNQAEGIYIFKAAEPKARGEL